ncbi:hypothetical protein PE067_09470 [Paracoccus sp. DMF-8]|uniref:phage upper tail fiber protein n=1 Tax=Paracoccus sp. DMF-8 TaxID=3019445 RepID=UPI0023E81C06|nr:hypothetical protein [Paracoccus sp. DMF-8]MDF3606348.1 hypothetical protein [Paracoccus sp. DMF-8]
MPISQTTITGSFKTPVNADAQLTDATFKLSGSDFEGGEGITANTVTAAVVTEDGDFTVTLWPNDRGMTGGTSYAVSFRFSDGSTMTMPKALVVSHSDTPVTLEDVVFENQARGAVKPNALRILTQAQYDALTPKDPNTVYLIRG